MKYAALFVLLAGFITGCDEIISPLNKMRPNQPVVVDTPTTINSLDYDSALFLISISDRNTLVKYQGRETRFTEWKELDSFIKMKCDTTARKHIALKADTKEYKRIDSAIQILKANNIFQFNLITDLEKRP